MAAAAAAAGGGAGSSGMGVGAAGCSSNEARVESIKNLIQWMENNYNPNWLQDTLDLLWNDPIDYWSNLLNEKTESDSKKKKKNKKRNRDQVQGDIDELIDREQGIRDSIWGPDQRRPGRTGQRIKDRLKDWTRR
jgi:hypothetical protein